MRSKKFSVIVAHYNQMNYIKEALYSILIQDYNNIELIIVDDCSNVFDKNDIDKFIANNKKENITKVKYIENKTNMGTVKSLNKALKVLEGDYVLFFAADDKLYDRNVLTNFVKTFENHKKENIITAQSIMCDNNLEKVFEEYVDSYKSINLNNKSNIEQYEIMCENCIYSSGATAYRKEIFDKYGEFDEKYKLIEDWTYWLKVLRLGEKIYFHNFKALLHRDGGVSHNNSKKIPPHVIQYYRDLLNAYKYDVMPYIKNISKEHFYKILSKYLYSIYIFSQRSEEIKIEFQEEKITFFEKYNISKEEYEIEIENNIKQQKLFSLMKKKLKESFCHPFRKNKILKLNLILNISLFDILKKSVYFYSKEFALISLLLIFIITYFFLNKIEENDYILTDSIVLSTFIITILKGVINSLDTLYIIFLFINVLIYIFLKIIFIVRNQKK